MGRCAPNPDSEVDLWSDLTAKERECFEKMLPAEIRPQISQFLGYVPLWTSRDYWRSWHR